MQSLPGERDHARREQRQSDQGTDDDMIAPTARTNSAGRSAPPDRGPALAEAPTLECRARAVQGWPAG